MTGFESFLETNSFDSSIIDTVSEISTDSDITSVSSNSFGSSKSSSLSCPFSNPADTECNKVDLVKSFRLATNYPPQVEVSLTEKSMTTASTRLFLTAIVRAMYAVKRYPTGQEFDFIGRLVIDKYPFLRSPIGNGYVSWHMVHMVSELIVTLSILHYRVTL